jgi:hypothetical protein
MIQSTSRSFNPVIVIKNVEIKFSADDTSQEYMYPSSWYTQNRKIGKSNNALGAIKPKDQNRPKKNDSHNTHKRANT